jgi:hypothetical protein
LKIVPSCDIGSLGPAEGAAITYYWNPIYNVTGTLPWLLVVVVFVLFKENRTLKALWILLPVILFRLLWAAFAALMSIPSEAAVIFISIVNCLLIGFALNWLLAERIGNRNRFITWLLAWVVFAAVLVVMLGSLGFGAEAVAFLIFIGLSVGILMVSFPLAAFLCRKKFGPVRFSLWMALWVLLMTVGFFLTVGFIQSLMINYSMVMILIQVLTASLIYAGILIVGLLPFEIVLFKSSFWRKRFEAVFGIKTRPAVEPVELSELKPPPNE